jgi:hypothetical protein
MPDAICSTCHQPIREGEETDTFRGEMYHCDPHCCVAAVVRRFVEITESKRVPKGWLRDEGRNGWDNACIEIEDAIRAEFPESKNQ